MNSTHTGRTGFTIIELLITLVVSAIVMGAVFSLTTGVMASVESNRQNDGIGRSARLVSMSLARDFQQTGVSLESTAAFGSLNVWADTIAILHVPFEPTEAPPYTLKPPTGTDNPLPAGGTCGARCLDLNKSAGQFDLRAGDLARLQINAERRLILIETVQDMGTYVQVTFSGDSLLLQYPAGLSGGLALDRYATYVQQVGPILYYRDGTALMRAESMNTDGTPAGEPLVYGVEAWDAWIVFVDGDEATEVDILDTDYSNDFDDLLGARIEAVLGADIPILRADSTIADETRHFEWRYAPRNLTYERNRIQN